MPCPLRNVIVAFNGYTNKSDSLAQMALGLATAKNPLQPRLTLIGVLLEDAGVVSTCQVSRQ